MMDIMGLSSFTNVGNILYLVVGFVPSMYNAVCTFPLKFLTNKSHICNLYHLRRNWKYLKDYFLVVIVSFDA